MIITPNIKITDKQLIALQGRAIRMEKTLEEMIEESVISIANKEITSQTINGLSDGSEC